MKVALLGLTGVGEMYLNLLREDQRFDLIAIGDTESDVLKSISDSISIRCYDDMRSLIVESARSGLNAIMVALEPFQSVEYLHLAAKYNVAVYHKPPFARNVQEARKLIKPFQEKNLPFVISQLWPVEPKVARWGRWEDLLGYTYCASGHVQTTDLPTGWRGDRLRAGGGVLLNGAYEQTHFLIQRFGTPQTVFARCCRAYPTSETRNYDTEDAVTVVFDFDNDRTAGLTAWRSNPTAQINVSITGTSGILHVQQHKIELTSTVKNKTRRAKIDTASSIASEMGALATVCMGDVCTSLSHGDQHITTLATIEAAYLSAKTGAPESPQQFLNDG